MKKGKLTLTKLKVQSFKTNTTIEGSTVKGGLPPVTLVIPDCLSIVLYCGSEPLLTCEGTCVYVC